MALKGAAVLAARGALEPDRRGLAVAAVRTTPCNHIAI